MKTASQLEAYDKYNVFPNIPFKIPSAHKKNLSIN